MNKKIFIFGGVAVLVVAGFWLTSKKSAAPAEVPMASESVLPTDSGAAASVQPSPTPATSPAGTNAAVKEFKVISTSFKYSVNEIKVKKGDTVRIVLQNEEGFHDWKVDEFNAATKQLKVGETDTIEFVADKSGTFEYYCSVGKHRQMGMVGKLIVE